MTDNDIRETLCESDDFTLRRYQTGQYGITVHGLRVIFSDVRTPSAASIHEFLNDEREHVASVGRSQVPHEVTLALDEIEDND